MIRSDDICYCYFRRASLHVSLNNFNQVLTLAARVSLSPLSPTQMLRQSFRIFRSLIGFLSLASLTILEIGLGGDVFWNERDNINKLWLKMNDIVRGQQIITYLVFSIKYTSSTLQVNNGLCETSVNKCIQALIC